MPYGILKVDTITFTAGGVDTSVSISGLVQNPTFTGNITSTGTISGNIIQGSTTVSGATVTGTAGQFGTLTGNTAGFTTITGTTITGTTANLVTVSGTTVTGNAGSFTTVTGGVATITSGVFAVGAEALPSVSFASDPNTGIYSPGADQVAISTNGTGRLFVDSSGNIGVGASPVVAFAGQTHLTVNHSTGGTTVAGINLATDGTRRASLITYPSNSEALRITAESATLPITFYTNSNERMRLDSSGRLGVGTSSPTQDLEIARGVGTSAYISLRGNNESAATGFFVGQDSSGLARLFQDGNKAITFWTGGAATERVRIDSSGRVGIGVTSPGALLDCKVTSTKFVRITDDQATSNTGVIRCTESDGTNRGMGVAGNFIAFLQGADSASTITERARIDSSGRLLVGTSSSRQIGEINHTQQIEGGNAVTGVSVVRCSPDAGQPVITFGKARGSSVGSTTIVQSGDFLGTLLFAGADGSTLTSVASRIDAVVEGTPAAGKVASRLVFSTTADGAASPTERMRIKETGHAKFSNTGSYRSVNTGNHEFLNSLNTIGLEIYNTNASQTTTVLQVSADRNTTNGTYNLIQASRIGVSDCFRVLDSGNVQNTNNSYTGISDVKLKENIVDANSQWGDIKSLKVRKFNFKEETGNSTHTQIGLIAQEVEQVSPKLVLDIADRDAEGNDLGTVTKSVNYSVLYMKAVKALQEAIERIEQLEAEMAEVKAQLS